MTVNAQRCSDLADAITHRQQSQALVPLPDFDMKVWGRVVSTKQHWRNEDTKSELDVNICGTVGCIAGCAVAMFDPVSFRRLIVGLPVFDNQGYELGFDDIARRLLDMDDDQDQADALFIPTIGTDIVRWQDAVAMLHWLASHPDADGDAIEEQWKNLIRRQHVVR
jgi:hypothetical protein